MAAYVKLLRSIWRDADFRTLSSDAQRLYMLLISQADINHAGVLSLAAGRWANLAPDTTPVDIRTGLDELAAARFIVIDPDTEELWVRSYIVHDEAWRSPNGKKALVKAHAAVLSEGLRQAITTTIERASQAPPEGAPQGDAAPQQPAAIASSHEPAASSPAPTAAPDEPTQLDSPGARAAAAIELHVEQRILDKQPHNPAGFARTIREDDRSRHGAALDQYLAQHPAATADELAHEVLGVPRTAPPAAPSAPAHDDDCACEGTGLVCVDTAGQGTYTPCTAVPRERANAPVIPIRRTP